jgi:hypothetical protein
MNKNILISVLFFNILFCSCDNGQYYWTNGEGRYYPTNGYLPYELARQLEPFEEIPKGVPTRDYTPKSIYCPPVFKDVIKNFRDIKFYLILNCYKTRHFYFQTLKTRQGKPLTVEGDQSLQNCGLHVILGNMNLEKYRAIVNPILDGAKSKIKSINLFLNCTDINAAENYYNSLIDLIKYDFELFYFNNSQSGNPSSTKMRNALKKLEKATNGRINLNNEMKELLSIVRKVSKEVYKNINTFTKIASFFK